MNAITFRLQLSAGKEVELLQARAVQCGREASQAVALGSAQHQQTGALQLQAVQLRAGIH